MTLPVKNNYQKREFFESITKRQSDDDDDSTKRHQNDVIAKLQFQSDGTAVLRRRSSTYSDAVLSLLLLRRFGGFHVALFLRYLLDDADSHRLSHVTHSESAQRCILGELFHAHGFRWHHPDHGSVAALHHLRILLQDFVATTIDLRQEGFELACHVGGVTKPRLTSLTETFLMLKPTLSPGLAASNSW